MQITKVEPHIVAVPPEGEDLTDDSDSWSRTNWVFLEVETDKGITDWGSAIGLSTAHRSSSRRSRTYPGLRSGRTPST